MIKIFKRFLALLDVKDDTYVGKNGFIPKVNVALGQMELLPESTGLTSVSSNDTLSGDGTSGDVLSVEDSPLFSGLEPNLFDKVYTRLTIESGPPVGAIDANFIDIQTNNGAVSIVLTNPLSVSPPETIGGRGTQFHLIKDITGNAATNNITVTVENSGTIDSKSSYVINTNYGYVLLTRRIVKGSSETQDWYIAGKSNDKAIIVKTSNYTLTRFDNTVKADTLSNDITITLPTAVGIESKEYTIKKIASANTVTIDADGTETIDNNLTIDLTTQYDSLTIISDGANWWIN